MPGVLGQATGGYYFGVGCPGGMSGEWEPGVGVGDSASIITCRLTNPNRRTGLVCMVPPLPK